jgi:hypothetical protein
MQSCCEYIVHAVLAAYRYGYYMRLLMLITICAATQYVLLLYAPVDAYHTMYCTTIRAELVAMVQAWKLRRATGLTIRRTASGLYWFATPRLTQERATTSKVIFMLQ